MASGKDTIKPKFFYDYLTSKTSNDIIVALAYSEYKRLKIEYVKSLRNRQGKNKLSKSVIEIKLADWQADECNKVEMYINNARLAYDESISNLLEEPLRYVESQHQSFRDNVKEFCPKHNKRLLFWEAVGASLVAWIGSWVIIIVLAISNTERVQKFLMSISNF